MKWLWLGLLGCGGVADAGPTDPPGESVSGVTYVGATVLGGGPSELSVSGDRIAAAVDGPRVDLTGRFLVPAFIDSHAHVVYDPRRAELAAGGIAGVVDWAAPLDRLTADPAGPDVVWSGPMITAVDGYPLYTWGRDGYGLPVSTPDEGRAAVRTVLDAGATVVKLPLPAEGEGLTEATMSAIIDEAHTRGAKVGVHALSPSWAEQAARLDADVLVHAPNGPLSEEGAALWSGRALVPTISAFGGVEATRQLREAGATILYGTDFGNTRTAGISRAELDGMVRAGMDGEAILEAGTSAPAAFFGLDDLGSLEVGKQASFLVLDRDPRVDPLVLAEPVAVVHRGRLVAGEL